MKVDYDLYYKDSGSVNKGHYVESNESVTISLSHDYTTDDIFTPRVDRIKNLQEVTGRTSSLA